MYPPKNGKIALLLTTNGLTCSKHVSQKRNEAIDDCQWYKMLLKYTYSVISVKLDSLPGNSKKWGIDLFVAFAVRLVHSWARQLVYALPSSSTFVHIYRHIHMYICFDYSVMTTSILYTPIIIRLCVPAPRGWARYCHNCHSMFKGVCFNICSCIRFV